jgi:choline kinase
VSPVEHAVIAAAGFGSRLGRGYPKCLVRFRGRTLLERQLELLEQVPDVRLVVGFCEHEVVAHAREVRPDVLVVRNPAYATTTTLTSYALGARHLAGPTLFMDADILFEPASFAAFLAACTRAPLIGYTHARTADAVFVDVRDGHVRGFSRDVVSPFEWANLAFLPPSYCERGEGSVYGQLALDLPLAATFVDSFEVDRPADLALAEREYVGVPHQRAGVPTLAG